MSSVATSYTPGQHSWNYSYAQGQHLWNYGGKVILVARHLLNAAARIPSIALFAGDHFPNQAKKMVTRLKLFSIISSLPTTGACFWLAPVCP